MRLWHYAILDGGIRICKRIVFDNFIFGKNYTQKLIFCFHFAMNDIYQWYKIPCSRRNLRGHIGKNKPPRCIEICCQWLTKNLNYFTFGCFAFFNLINRRLRNFFSNCRTSGEAYCGYRDRYDYVFHGPTSISCNF